MTSLIAEITARAHPASRVVLIDLAEGWLGGCDLPAVGKVCDGALLCVYALGPEEAAAVIRQGLEALGAEKFLGAGFRLFNGEVGGAEGLTARVAACVEAGANALNFYNYGLFPGQAARLDRSSRRRQLKSWLRFSTAEARRRAVSSAACWRA